ncbi:LCP family protein [Streptomyces vinaceus]
MHPKMNFPVKIRHTFRVLFWICVSFSLVAVAFGSALYLVANGNLKSRSIAMEGGSGGREKDGSQYVLLLGSDARSGENGTLVGGDSESARSDVIMVAHIPNRSGKMTVISIPRDTLVDIPACTDSAGNKIQSRRHVLINSAYQAGGPRCVVRTVEKLMGVRMTHFIGMDFSGLAKVVDAIGGVTVTADEPIKDRTSGLDIPAGASRLDGVQSLAFVRTRHAVGDGSDLARIPLQQKFLLSVLREVSARRVLTDPAKVYRLVDTATDTLTVDSGLASASSLTRFAQGFSRFDAKSTETIMLPVRPDIEDDEKIIVDEKRASALWRAIKDGQRVPAAAMGRTT